MSHFDSQVSGGPGGWLEVRPFNAGRGPVGKSPPLMSGARAVGTINMTVSISSTLSQWRGFHFCICRSLQFISYSCTNLHFDFCNSTKRSLFSYVSDHSIWPNCCFNGSITSGSDVVSHPCHPLSHFGLIPCISHFGLKFHFQGDFFFVFSHTQ